MKDMKSMKIRSSTSMSFILLRKCPRYVSYVDYVVHFSCDGVSPAHDDFVVARWIDGRIGRSDPELPQMMIDVQVSPPQPRPAGHRPEERMRWPGFTGAAHHDVHERQECGDIGREIGGRRAADALLDLRPRLDA